MNIERAISLAAKYHEGQVDKGGKPYILHPLQVMSLVDSMDAKMVAVMHDIIEDTPVTAELLRSEGFSDFVIDAIIALTKKDGMSKMEAAIQAKKNPIARLVKIADLTCNMDLSRIPSPTDRDIERNEKYAEALDYLRQ